MKPMRGQEAFWLTSPSHGENRGSSPLGSANSINSLALANLSSHAPYGNCTE
jgi:hypothetical protein